MPRRDLYITNRFPYHVTARSNNKEWFYLPLPICWDIFCEKLSDHSAKYGTMVHAFVLMQNHFHMILTTPTLDLGLSMRHLMTEVSKAIQKRSKRINHVFGNRYKWSVLDTSYGIGYVYKYVMRNPARAGICSHVEQYDFSSLTERRKKMFPPITESIEPIWRYVPKDRGERLAWLNKPAPKELEKLITKGLRRQEFAFSKGNEVRKALLELEALYGVVPDGVTATFSAERETDIFS